MMLLRVPRPPTITSMPPVVACVGEAYDYTVTAEDPDPGDTITFSLLEGPEGMSVDPDTGACAYQPEEGDTGQHAVRIQAADGGGLTAIQAFDLTVQFCSNRPPRIILRVSGFLSAADTTIGPTTKANNTKKTTTILNVLFISILNLLFD